MIYIRQGKDCAEVVVATDDGLEVHKLNMTGLLALIETASRIALVLNRDAPKQVTLHEDYFSRARSFLVRLRDYTAGRLGARSGKG